MLNFENVLRDFALGGLSLMKGGNGSPHNKIMKNKSKLILASLGVAVALIAAVSLNAAGKVSGKSADCCTTGATCCVQGAACCAPAAACCGTGAACCTTHASCCQ